MISMVTTGWCAPVTPLAGALAPAPASDVPPSAANFSGDDCWGAAAFSPDPEDDAPF